MLIRAEEILYYNVIFVRVLINMNTTMCIVNPGVTGVVVFHSLTENSLISVVDSKGKDIHIMVI